MTTLSKEDVVRIDNELLAMIQKHFPSLPLDDRYTDWKKWLCFARAVYSHGEQAARADIVAENERLLAANLDCIDHFNAAMEDITATRTALAAAEARESATRAILDQVMDDIRSEAFLFDGGNGISADTEDAADNLLDQPRDDSALREMIAGVYEECAKVCDLFEQKADALNDSIADDDGANEGRSEYIMGKATASSRIAKAIRALAEKSTQPTSPPPSPSGD